MNNAGLLGLATVLRSFFAAIIIVAFGACLTEWIFDDPIPGMTIALAVVMAGIWIE